MVQLGLTPDLKRQGLQWGGAAVTIKDIIRLPGKKYLICRKMCKVVMHTSEPVSTREATQRRVNMIYITYKKEDLEQVATKIVQLNDYGRIKLMSILNGLEDLFDVTLVEWEIENVKIELKPNCRPVNSKYYLVYRINKDTFQK